MYYRPVKTLARILYIQATTGNTRKPIAIVASCIGGDGSVLVVVEIISPFNRHF